MRPSAEPTDAFLQYQSLIAQMDEDQRTPEALIALRTEIYIRNMSEELPMNRFGMMENVLTGDKQPSVTFRLGELHAFIRAALATEAENVYGVPIDTSKLMDGI